MKFNSKTLLAVVLLAFGLLLLLLLLVLAEKLLSIWHYLQQAPLWLLVVYVMLLMAAALIPVWLWLKLTRPSGHAKPRQPVVDETSLNEAIQTAAQRGVDIAPVQAELDELHRRRGNQLFYISLFGHASSGKSSLVQALIPAAETSVDVVKGTTVEVLRYRHEQLEITDLPGFDAIDQAELAEMAMEESQRAHVVVFLLSSDFSRTEMGLFKMLQDWRKPMVIALNKSDQYSQAELSQLQQAINAKTKHEYPVVIINTGGSQTVIKKLKEGSQQTQVVLQKPDIKPLLKAIEQVVKADAESLHRFRDAGILLLADQKLKQANEAHNRLMAERTIERHTKRAMVGAMASIAPGSDIIIQGAIGSQMVKELCQLYEVPVKQLQIDEILRSAGGKLKTSTSMILAVAGNAFKAFPGVGTAAGGLLHAVAYGLIFNALGRAVMITVTTTGELDAAQTKRTFEDNLLGPSEQMAKNLAQMALSIRQQKKSLPND